MGYGSTRSMRQRALSIILVITVLLFGASSVNLMKYMLFDSAFYQKKATMQQLQDTEISAKRGDIYDRNMEVLATSATAYTVYITPQDIKDDDTAKLLAKGLSELLDVEYDKVYNATKKSTYYEKIKTKIDQTLANKVRTFISENKLGAIVGLDEGSKRYYPNDNLASTVLGFVGADNQGLNGLESYYDDMLKGVPGRVIAAKNATGADMPFSYEKVVDAQTGNSLVLTIDSYIQYVAEKYLEEAVSQYSCNERGCVIVMDPKTGEIYAMATKPDYNPNTPFTIYDSKVAEAIEELTGDERTKAVSAAQQKQWRNKAICDTYEPGSVFKIVTGSAAYEESKISKNSTFNCSGKINIAGTTYNCHKHSGHGHQNLAGAFQNSCNPAFIQIGQMLGTELFFKYFQAYGLTEKTGIDLPGEASTVAGVSYHDISTMSIVDLASESFGQGFNVTPIQLATAVCASVNGGYLVKPHVVKKIVDSEGNTVKKIEKTVKRQVISDETSKAICSFLEGVVTEGSGKNSYVAGYRVGGKTGTSQKLAQSNADGVKRLVASFCGVAPCDDAQLVCLVVLDEPNAPVVYGGTLAAPVAGKIFADVLPYLGVEAVYTEEELKNIDIAVPSAVGKQIDDAKRLFESSGISVKTVGNGEKVVRQLPTAGHLISRGGTVVLYTDDTENAKVTVPDFSGYSISGANSLASQHQLNITLAGVTGENSGATAYSQSIAPGEKVDMGTIITVSFRVSSTD
ncbi:MAG: PASTA domain-containing protein [Clostridia bacterium]|nr:PASTA domain-containing protein [Clostridia bacterium]